MCVFVCSWVCSCILFQGRCGVRCVSVVDVRECVKGWSGCMGGGYVLRVRVRLCVREASGSRCVEPYVCGCEESCKRVFVGECVSGCAEEEVVKMVCVCVKEGGCVCVCAVKMGVGEGCRGRLTHSLYEVMHSLYEVTLHRGWCGHRVGIKRICAFVYGCM